MPARIKNQKSKFKSKNSTGITYYFSYIFWWRRLTGYKRLFAQVITVSIIILFGGWIAADLLLPTQTHAAWFNDSWQYRKPINITVHTSAESNVYLNLASTNALDTSDTSRFQTDCGDLRFTDKSGQLLPYYIVSGCGTATTVVHVFMQSFPAGAQTVYYYYGNPSAVNGFSSSDFATVASNVTIGSFGSEEKGPSPVGYWAFDEGSGTIANDSTANKKNGTVSGAVWTTEERCISDKCLQFDGSNDNVTVANGTNTAMTVAVWMRSGTNKTWNVLADNNMDAYDNAGGWYMGKDVNHNDFVFSWFNAGGTQGIASLGSPTELFDNKWHYVVGVKGEDGRTRLYVDGVLRNTFNTVVTGTTNTLPTTYIGSQFSSTYFQGFLDEFKIYGYERSAAQIKADLIARGSQEGSNSVLGTKDQGFLSNGLVGYWKMDESAANTCTATADNCDSSGNSNSLFWSGLGSPTASAAAKFGSGVEFESDSTQFASAATSSTLSQTGDISTAVWIKPESVTASTLFTILAKWSGLTQTGYNLSQYGDEIRMYIDSPNDYVTTTTANLSRDTWYHVVGVYDSHAQTVKIYINGVQQTTTITGTIPSAMSTNVIDVGVGGYTNAFGDPVDTFDGVMDELRLYNRAFSSDEATALYQFAPGPVGYWDFEEGSGATAIDRSGNGLNGSWSSPAWTAGKYGRAGSFNGAGSGITIGSQALVSPGLGNWSMCFWINTTATGVSGQIAGKNQFGFSDWGAMLTTTGTVRFAAKMTNPPGTNTQSDSPVVNDGRWHHLCGIFDRYKDGLWIYTDGKSTGANFSLTGAKNENFAADTFKIGSQPAVGNFNGAIDEVRYYNYLITKDQVTEMMNADHPITTTNSMLLNYKFDAGFGNVASNSGSLGSTANGGMYNFASPPSVLSGWTQHGKYNKALNFDGINDHVRIEDPFYSNELTLSAWVNPRAYAGTDVKVIIAKRAAGTTNLEYQLSLSTTGTVRLDGWNSAGTNFLIVTTTKILPLNTWSQVSATYDGTIGVIYIDGVAAASTVVSGTFQNTTNPITIGSCSTVDTGCTNGATRLFNGLIDEVKIYNYALSPQSIKLDLNQSSALRMGSLGMTSTNVASNSSQAVYCVPGDTTQACSPIGEWRFEEGKGSSANDTSGKGNNGVFNDATTTHWAKGKIGSAGNFIGGSSTTDYVNVGHVGDLDGKTQMTFTGWFNTAALSATSRVLISKWSSSQRQFIFQTDNSQNDELLLFIATVVADAGSNFARSTTVNFVPNQWYHVAVRFDGTQSTNATRLRLFVNGVEHTLTYTGTIPSVMTSPSAGTNATIGNSLELNTREWNGKLDEFRLYDYPLSPAQIAWDYNRGKPIAQYKFDECQGTTVNDWSGNGLPASITIGAGTSPTTVGTCTTASTAWGNGVNGKYNSSLSFDGADDYATIGTSSLLAPTTNGFTISSWAKATTWPSSLQVLLARNTSGLNGEYYLGVFQNKVRGVVYGVSNGSKISNSGSTLVNGQWVHMVMAWSGVSTDPLLIYVNGKLNSSTELNQTLTSVSTSTEPTLIGAKNNSSKSAFFAGQIDETQYFNYALTPIQIQLLYNQSSAVRFGPATGTP